MTSRGVTLRRVGAVLAVGLATVAVDGAAVAAASGAPSGAVRLELPRPTGHHAVGVRSIFVLDPSRIEPATGGSRAVPVRVWYPAESRHGRRAPYLSTRARSAVEAFVGAPAGLLDIQTHATADAPARGRIRGVLLVSPAAGFQVAFYTGLITELASRGYAVVSFDHPHETFVEQPDGTTIDGDIEDLDAAFDARLLDAKAVVGAVRTLIPEAGSDTPIGMFGHSFGGSTAGEAMRVDPRIRAGVSLDGTIIGPMLTEGLDRPFGMMLSADLVPEELEDIATLGSNMRAPHPVQTLGIHHHGYTDFVLFNAQAQRSDPAVGALLEATFATGTLHNRAASHWAFERQRQFVVEFFDRYLTPERPPEPGR